MYAWTRAGSQGPSSGVMPRRWEWRCRRWKIAFPSSCGNHLLETLFLASLGIFRLGGELHAHPIIFLFLHSSPPLPMPFSPLGHPFHDPNAYLYASMNNSLPPSPSKRGTFTLFLFLMDMALPLTIGHAMLKLLLPQAH